jgi:hypothetical protein
MATVNTFDAYGKRFHFEPPVEVGVHSIDSLGKLATIAWCGPEDANIEKIKALASMTDQALALIHGFTETRGFADFLSETASRGGQNYTVTVE